MGLKTQLFSLQRIIDDFLQRVADSELRLWSVDQKLDQLEDIVYGRKKEFWRIYSRFISFGNWLSQEGVKILDDGFNPQQLERIIGCIEKIKEYKNRIKEKKRRILINSALHLGNSFAREGIRKLGMEYTPLGLVESIPSEFREKLREKIPRAGDIKDNFVKTLDYQKEMLENFYKPGDHLLTVLNNQINSLERRPSLEDEVFTASLLYYLKKYDYKISAYLERFKNITLRKTKK
ncbi:MAG: hypothetical protein WBD28_05590 [Candidatus Zixiibacteriota bacterium]